MKISMKKINESFEKLENDIEKVSGMVEEPVENMMTFIKEHKKVLMIVAIIYIIYRYLFSEDE